MFGLFKNKKRKDENIVKQIYDRMNSESRDKIFYGGYEQADVILNRINALFQKTDKYTQKESFDICNQIYIQVWIRKHGGLSPEFSETEYIKKRLAERFSFIDTGILMKIIDECILIIYEKEPEIKQRDVLLENRKIMCMKNALENKGVELKNVDSPAYGLVPEMPVFVDGFGNDKIFLENLMTFSGEPTVYNRLGSFVAEGISGPVDIYDISKSDGTPVGQIFVCNYGTTMPPKAPFGYVLRNNGVWN